MPEAIIVRQYRPPDYPELQELYKSKELYGGEFSEYRDSREVLDKIASRDPHAILVAELDGEIAGTVSLIENERVAWLYRFCVLDMDRKDEISAALYEKAEGILSKRGHKQVLVYSDPANSRLDERYAKLGFNRGGNYACFWKDIRA